MLGLFTPKARRPWLAVASVLVLLAGALVLLMG